MSTGLARDIEFAIIHMPDSSYIEVYLLSTDLLEESTCRGKVGFHVPLSVQEMCLSHLKISSTPLL